MFTIHPARTSGFKLIEEKNARPIREDCGRALRASERPFTLVNDLDGAGAFLHPL
jgi:hypothetical protein